MHSLEQVLRNRRLLTAHPGDLVLDVIQRMTAARVGAATILDGEHLVGVFSERDLMTRVVVAGRAVVATLSSGRAISSLSVKLQPVAATTMTAAAKHRTPRLMWWFLAAVRIGDHTHRASAFGSRRATVP